MTHRTKTRFGWALALAGAWSALGAGAAPALALDVESMRATLVGQGRWAQERDFASVTQVTTTFNANQRFELRFSPATRPGVRPGSENVVINGTWRNEGNQLALTIERALGNATANGTGRVRFARRGGRLEPESISFNGSARQGNFWRAFELDFTASSVRDFTISYAHSGDFEALDVRRTGSGRVRLDRAADDARIRQARVQLQRGGRAIIEFEGERRWQFEGTWRRVSSTRVDLAVTGLSSTARSGSAQLGRGTIELDGAGSFTRINLSGSLGREDFNASFDAGGTSSRPGVGGPDLGGAGNSGDELRGNYNVSGNVEGRGLSRAVNSVNVSLDRNRRARLTIAGAGRSYTLDGTWSPSIFGTYSVTLRGAQGETLSGRITRAPGRGNVVDGFDLRGNLEGMPVTVRLRVR